MPLLLSCHTSSICPGFERPILRFLLSPQQRWIDFFCFCCTKLRKLYLKMQRKLLLPETIVLVPLENRQALPRTGFSLRLLSTEARNSPRKNSWQFGLWLIQDIRGTDFWIVIDFRCSVHNKQNCARFRCMERVPEISAVEILTHLHGEKTLTFGWCGGQSCCEWSSSVRVSVKSGLHEGSYV